jgi:hypothetical protein
MIFETEWNQITCCTCQGLFAMPTQVRDRYHENHEIFKCPYCGQEQYFLKESKEERYRKLAEYKEQCCIAAREEAKRLERKVIAYKGVVTKMNARRKNAKVKC